MSFGRNPHLAKAQAAEQKAADAGDASTRARAYRDAAHQWDRAAEREPPGKRRVEYEQNAERNRELAESDDGSEAEQSEVGAMKAGSRPN
jgi:hypothetical protein